MENEKQYSEARGYNLGIARELGLPGAVLYNQLLFWAARSKDDWFFKTYEDLVNELPLSRMSIIRAKETLEKADYIETSVRKANGTPVVHWRIVRFATFNSTKLVLSESTNLVLSINNKENNKELPKSKKNSDEIEKLYTTYLDRFIIPTRLKDLTQYTGPELLAMARTRYKLTPKRRAAISRRIEDAGFKLVGAAIIGFSREPWYLGENDRNWIADLETYICRSYENIEKGAELYEAQKKERPGR